MHEQRRLLVGSHHELLRYAFAENGRRSVAVLQVGPCYHLASACGAAIQSVSLQPHDGYSGTPSCVFQQAPEQQLPARNPYF